MSDYFDQQAEQLKQEVKGFHIDPITKKIALGRMILSYPFHVAARILRPETKKVIRNLIKDRQIQAIWR